MQTELTILTGHSRGMGRAMAQQLLVQGHRLLGISRGRAQGLAPGAGAAGELIEWQADLADGAEVARRLQSWLDGQADPAWRSVTLINNAAAIPAIVPLSRARPEDLAQAMRVNLETPMQLRGAPDADFPDRQGFEGLHQQGMLTAPEVAAERLLAFLASPDFGQQPVADVRA